ncbi:DUF6515 family protein [Mucilaginibacter auburnensis]|uniref:WG repeat protein n=1 Tax=Mucilaginibacter auburnensis TaxID=1457233 RepID=A0A2H9VS68_9SPHI|nr:DUF6515 family protein [Mucilaginibacter auburnensis]PJJ83660.1 hypothetical protein CLV57_0648 [Mucilaginibacter auburnensis]
MKTGYITLAGTALLLCASLAVDAQRRGLGAGGGMSMPRPQPSVAQPRSYNPPRGADVPQGFGQARRGNDGAAGLQPNTYPQGSYPNAPRRGTDINVSGINRPSTRQPAGSNRVYRVWEGLPYGRNYISVRPQGLYYYYSNGFYASYYAPRIGLVVDALPYGYYPFYYGPTQYFYGGGMYYQQTGSSYTVVEPPIGAEVKQLPEDAKSIVINDVQYYELNGVYYQPITKDDGTQTYQIAGKDGQLNTDDVNVQDAPPIQVGDLVDNLPEDYKKVNLNGQLYYVTPSGYYLQDAVDENGKKVYKIISVPAPDADDDKR